ncbi:MAG: RNase adapter RapZ [Acidobacteriota bacterium]
MPRQRATAASLTSVPGRFVIVTGLSGAGKSQAIHALEDLGYFCVDNLPTALIPTLGFLATRAGSDLEKVAIVVDVREGSFLADFPKLFRKLKRSRLSPVLVFLEARESVLVRRFSETRRPHPLALNRPVREGIREETRRMRPIRAMADEIVDTSTLTVHDLRAVFRGLASGAKVARPLQITLVSFGFKHGLPPEADLVFDVRFLPNPHFVPRLRPLTGRDDAVVRFMETRGATGEAVGRFGALLQYLVPQYAAEGKTYLTVAIGCTGGRHRSVYVAEAIRSVLEALPDVGVHVRHRDIAGADE